MKAERASPREGVPARPTLSATRNGVCYRRGGGLRYTPAMAIHPDLLEILACPVCKIPVEPVKDGQGLYPVRDDIPIMLPEEATIEG